MREGQSSWTALPSYYSRSSIYIVLDFVREKWYLFRCKVDAK